MPFLASHALPLPIAGRSHATAVTATTTLKGGWGLCAQNRRRQLRMSYTSSDSHTPIPSVPLHSSSLLSSPPQSASLDPSQSSRKSFCLCSRSTVLLVLGGQCISLLLTGTGVFSELLAESGVRLPTTQSFLNYLLLSFFLVPHYLAYRKRRELYQQTLNEQLLSDGSVSAASAAVNATQPTASSSTSSPSPSTSSYPLVSDAPTDADASQPVGPPTFLSIRWYWYLLLALCDVEGNYLLVTAYQYTTITSIQLLDCFTIPLIMLLSYCLLRTRYTVLHYAAAAVCLSGMGLLVVSDQLRQFHDDDGREARDQLIGDLLVLLGCACYAVSNLGQERIVKQQHRIEWLAMLGLFGTLISLTQMLATEHTALASLVLAPHVVAYLLGFVGCLYALYLAVPVLLARSGALFFNLSILTSDFWSVVCGVVLFHVRLHPLYFVAFVLIVVGLVMYEWAAAGRGWSELCCWRSAERQREERRTVNGAARWNDSGQG